MWQYIVVYIIGAIVVLYLIRSIYKAFVLRKKGDDARCPTCPGCVSFPKEVK